MAGRARLVLVDGKILIEKDRLAQLLRQREGTSVGDTERKPAGHEKQHGQQTRSHFLLPSGAEMNHS
jgi:hypothetical protein